MVEVLRVTCLVWLPGTSKVASKAAQPVQKVKQASKQATQRVSKQATRKVQQGTGSVKELLNEDTGSTLGAAGVLGFALLVAGGLVLGSEFNTPFDLQASAALLSHVGWHDGSKILC